ncbi:MAG: helix-turn-helix domain-containing protein [Deltaproteobacteria bacterium]|nr:helix-turn-helix domain-containing protein [Deltaproteobacteria bacterium]
MESPGEYLRRERELRGVSIGKIYEATRVPMKYLAALEADEYDTMPHPTFIKGYIKTYCKALGLDETDAVLRFEVFLREKNEKEHPEEYKRASLKKKREASSIPVHVPKGLKNNAAYAVGAAIVAVIVILYVAFGGKKEEPAPAPGPVATEAQVQAPADVTATAQTPVAAQPVTTAVPQPQKEAVVTTAPVQPVASPQKAPEAALQQLKAQAKEVLKPAPPPQATAQQAVQPPAQALPLVQPVEDSHTLSVTATDVAWVKIRIDSGEPFEVYLRPGESVSWKAKELFSLIVGNAGGVNLFHDGKKMPPLGKAGEVVSFKVPKGGSVQINQGPRPKPVKPVETVQPQKPVDVAAPEAKPQTEDKKEAAPASAPVAPENQ